MHVLHSPALTLTLRVLLLISLFVVGGYTASAQTLEIQNTDEAYSTILEEVLNQTIAPAPEKATTTPVVSTPKPVVETKPQTTPTTPKASTTPKKASASVATSTLASPTTPSSGLTKGQSGQNLFIPNNYYIPLDKLSPGMTYALSALAMLLGITGAVFIIREPQTDVVWAPNFEMQEALLEP